MNKTKQETTTLIPAQRRRPGGRGNVKALARDHSAAALAKLAELMQDPNSCVAFAAAKVLLDRGYGKVPVTYEPLGEAVRNPPLRVEITDLGQRGKGDAERA